ncbi:MAG TPA: hypothetical protein VFW50_22775, partial [Streptosporangiaceae bacterium]|nr:hypothetical protein [Streptosporangiaceae bacterium]
IIEHLRDRCGWYPLNEPEPGKVTWAVISGNGRAASRLPAAPHPGAARAAGARPAPALSARRRPVHAPAKAARAPKPVDPDILARVKLALERL